MKGVKHVAIMGIVDTCVHGQHLRRYWRSAANAQEMYQANDDEATVSCAGPVYYRSSDSVVLLVTVVNA